MRWSVLILLGVFFVSFASATIPGDCDSSMIAYWQFENNLLDSYGSHDGGAWTGTVRDNYGSSMIAGFGFEADFRGNEKIIIPNVDASYFNSAFTIEMWVKSSSSLTANLFEKGDYKIEWVFDIPSAYVNVTVGSSVVTSSVLAYNGLYHIALTWDSSGSILKLYVDGVEVDSAVLGGAADAIGNLIIGDGFTGLIDELAIYDDDLSESLINAHYLLGSAGKDYCDASGAEGGSSTKTVFNIRGCNFDLDGGGSFGVAKGRCSGLPHDGLYFCSEDQEAFVTKDLGLGCAMGNSNYDVENNNDFCCPPGFFCNETGTKIFQCAKRMENCFDQDNKGDCNNIGCIWLPLENGGEGLCSDGLRDYDCGYYDNGVDSDEDAEEACLNDSWKLGQIGIGTELCGTTFECEVDGVMEIFSVPEGDCACAWYGNAPEGQRCQVKLVGVQMFYDAILGPDKFECSNIYTLEDCIDGEQVVAWTSNNQNLSGFNSTSGQVPGECLAALNCVGGEKSRFCGEPIIKLPGFSLFTFFASLFFVGVCYFKREERFK